MADSAGTHSGGCFAGLFSRSKARKTDASVTVLPSKEPGRCITGHSNSRSSSSEEKDIKCFNPLCDFSYGAQHEWWVEGSGAESVEPLPTYSAKAPVSSAAVGDAAGVIDDALDKFSDKLRELSLKIHAHPELAFKETYAHDLLTDFLSKQGFKVTKHYLGLSTAWRAEYSQGRGGRTIGVNSEMDALPAMGHACGHNLIAMSGVGVALGLKAALQARKTVAGRIVLLGTPAEEGGGGKVMLLERGAYKEMDVCVMCHPTAGLPHSTAVSTTTAMQSLTVEYYGHSAHAAGAPWEGVNALDAAFSAYSSLSMLRQQIKPTHRMHGIIEGGQNWAPNVIPDYTKMRYIVRAPTFPEVEALVERVKNCFIAASMATGCKYKINLDKAYFDLHQNEVLAQDFFDIVESRYGVVSSQQQSSASTDFGNVSYALPSLHPAFAIPTVPNGGNHTPAFTASAGTLAAHEAAMKITKGLAVTSYRVLTDSDFFTKVKASYEASKVSQ